MFLHTDKLGKVAITIEEDYWSNDKDYDKLTIVEKEGLFGTFISRKPVPAGTPLTDRKFWIPFSSLKEEIVVAFNELVHDLNETKEIIDEKEANLYAAIRSVIAGGVALKQEFGDDEEYGISQKALTEFKEDIEEDISNINDVIGEDEAEGTLKGRIGVLENSDTIINQRITEELNRAQAAETAIINGYEGQVRSNVVILQSIPTGTGQPNTIYRVTGESSYTDYAWDGSNYVVLATYNNGIADNPAPESNNLVKGSGIYNADLAVLKKSVPTTSMNGSQAAGTIDTIVDFDTTTNKVVAGDSGYYRILHPDVKLKAGDVVHANWVASSGSQKLIFAISTVDPKVYKEEHSDQSKPLVGLDITIIKTVTSTVHDYDVVIPNDGWLLVRYYTNNTWSSTSVTAYREGRTIELIDAVTEKVDKVSEALVPIQEIVFGDDGKIEEYSILTGKRLTYVSTSDTTQGFYIFSSAADIHVYDMSAYKGKTVTFKYYPPTSNSSSKAVRYALVTDYQSWPTSAGNVTEEFLAKIISTGGTTGTSVSYKTYTVTIPDTNCYLLIPSLSEYHSESTPYEVIVNEKVRDSIDDTLQAFNNKLESFEENLVNDLDDLQDTTEAELEKKYVGGKLVVDNFFNDSIIGSTEVDITEQFSFTNGYSILTSGTASASRAGGLSNADASLSYSNVVNIEGADEIYIRLPYRKSINSHGGLAFYSELVTPTTSGVPAGTFLGSQETSGYSDASNLKTSLFAAIRVPQGAKYMATTWFSTSTIETYGTETLPAPFICKKIIHIHALTPKWEEEGKKVNVRVERGCINSETGLNATTWMNGYIRSSLYTKCVGTVSLTFSLAGLVRIFKYNDDFSLYSAETIDVTANEAFNFNTEGKYIRFYYREQELSEFPPIPKVTLQGVVSKTSLHPRPSNGYVGLTVPVNIVNPISTSSEPELDDELTVYPDAGILALPANYSPDGDPVRLIIFCHGAAVHYNTTNVSFNSQDIKPAYWLSEGYAIMDMDGQAFQDGEGNTVPHYASDDALACYVAGYEYVISHYNIKKDGVFVTGRSMGGCTCMKLVFSHRIPVIAACPHVPSINISTSMNIRTAADRAFYAQYLGFIGDAPTWTSSNPMTQDEWNYFKNNFDKLIRMYAHIYSATIVPTAEQAMADAFRISSNTASSTSEAAFYNSLALKTDVPIRITYGTNDSTVKPARNGAYLYNMLKNGGSYVEKRQYDVSRMTGDGSTHRFEIDPAFCADVVNSFGVTITNVPLLYVETLRFWRRFEQNGGY